MQHLKKVFCLLLLFYLVFHIALPGCYYLVFGYSPTYQKDIFDLNSVLKGVGLNVVSVLLATFLIYITRLNIVYKKQSNLRSTLFLAIAILVTIVDISTASSFADKIKVQGVGNGFIVFCSLVFNIESYLLFSLAASRTLFSTSGIVYVFFKLILASRSAPLTLVNIFMCSLASPNLKRHWKRFAMVVLISVLFSFQGFKLATFIREKSFSEDVHLMMVLNENLSTLQDNRGVVTKIIGRVSFLENMMLPIYYKDVVKIDLNGIFYEKYSLSNQLKILINNLVPGDVFIYDVYPNQYYRSAFLQLDPEVSKRDYTSINMTLPVFLYMFWGEMVAVIVAAVLIWGYFVLTAHIARIHPLFGFVLLAGLVGNFLAFFDIVMLVKMNLFGIFAALVYILNSKVAKLIPKKGVLRWLRY